MKYQKKPIIVDAWPWPEYPHDAPIFDPGYPINYQIVKTLEGNMKRSTGDWLIRGVSGEYYPCKPDIFEQTYTRIEEANDD